MKISPFLLLFILTRLTVYSQTTDAKARDQVKIDGNKVITKEGSFRTNLYDLDYIGQFKAIKKRPFLILTGRPCDSCDINNAIYIHSPSDGPLKEGKKQKKYNLPGPINDYQTRELLYEARLFWGEVLPGRFGIIWFQKEKKNIQWVESVYFAELLNDRIVDGFIKSELKKTVAQMEKGKAWEIKGDPMSSEPPGN